MFEIKYEPFNINKDVNVKVTDKIDESVYLKKDISILPFLDINTITDKSALNAYVYYNGVANKTNVFNLLQKVETDIKATSDKVNINTKAISNLEVKTDNTNTKVLAVEKKADTANNGVISANTRLDELEGSKPDKLLVDFVYNNFKTQAISLDFATGIFTTNETLNGEKKCIVAFGYEPSTGGQLYYALDELVRQGHRGFYIVPQTQTTFKVRNLDGNFLTFRNNPELRLDLMYFLEIAPPQTFENINKKNIKIEISGTTAGQLSCYPAINEIYDNSYVVGKPLNGLPLYSTIKFVRNIGDRFYNVLIDSYYCALNADKRIERVHYTTINSYPAGLSVINIQDTLGNGLATNSKVRIWELT